MTEKPKSVATILERELEAAIKEWLKNVNLLPALTCIPLNDTDRALHLQKLFNDLVCRLRLAPDAHLPVSTAATRHGQVRRLQVTLRPCLLRSQGCSRLLHSKHCIVIKTNSIKTKYF
jgi:hypothetical protein